MGVDVTKNFGSRECPSCACEVEANHNRCPICGYDFPNPTPAQKGMKLWGALLMLAIIAALMLRLL